MDEKQSTDSADLEDELCTGDLAADEDDLCAQSVDLTQWFSTALTATGSFDLGIVAATQFGKLLDALPIPILMVDGSYMVVFANQACAKISPNYERIQGVPFTTLVPRSRNAEKAQWVLRKVFTTRKLQVADGILEMEAKKIWGRLHFSAIRIGRERYVLVLIEDLTGERTQLLLNRRDDSQVRKSRQDLEKLVTKLTTELEHTRSKLASEVDRHSETRSALTNEKDKILVLTELVTGPVAVVTKAASFQCVNEKFRGLFLDPGDEIPLLSEWWKRTDLPEAEGPQAVVDQLHALAESDDAGQRSALFSFRTARGTEKRFSLKVVKLDPGDFVLLCGESAAFS
jgi:PAS domain-containing protein